MGFGGSRQANACIDGSRGGFRLLVPLVAIACVALLAGPAYAHDMGHRIPSGSQVDIGYHGLTEASRLATDWNINNNLHPTHLGTINVYVNQVREINVLDADYSPLDWSGLWECVKWMGTTQYCEQANVHYNLRYNHSLSATRWLACHEFGHALGIAHNGYGCMSATVYNVDQYLRSHNTDHVNAWY